VFHDFFYSVDKCDKFVHYRFTVTIRQTKYSDSEIINSAKPFDHKVDWVNSNPNMYALARRRKLVEIATIHMSPKQKSHTKASCLAAALKCKTRWEFRKKFKNEYASAHHNGWFEDIVTHMPTQSQTIYDSAETILKILKDGNYHHYGDLPKGLISKAKKFNILSKVKELVICGIKDDDKYRKPPNKNRPKHLDDWKNIISKYGLRVISNKIENSIPDKSGRTYEILEIQCSNVFQISNEQHPSFFRRITNIERDIRQNKFNCQYCTKPNWISLKGDKNRERDIERLKENLTRWSKEHNLKLAPNQKFTSAGKKFAFIDNATKEKKTVYGTSILYGHTINPFTQKTRMSDRFKTPYEKILRICNEKNFQLLNSEIEYLSITQYTPNSYSPSTKRAKFLWFDNEYEAPIIQIIKPQWFPKDYTISEEVVRFSLHKFLKYKFEFNKAYPSGLKNNEGHQLELDGYCSNVYGKAVAFEHQGGQHTTGIFMGKTLPNIIENDAFKRDWCKRNNIILIEIWELGNITKLEELPNIFLKNMKKNGVHLEGNQIDINISIEEINNVIGNKIPKRMDSIRTRMAQNQISIHFLGIDKALRVYVSVTNKNNYSKRIQLKILEKWSIEKINAFNRIQVI
jgi:hypothetical protein